PGRQKRTFGSALVAEGARRPSPRPPEKANLHHRLRGATAPRAAALDPPAGIGTYSSRPRARSGGNIATAPPHPGRGAFCGGGARPPAPSAGSRCHTAGSDRLYVRDPRGGGGGAGARPETA